MQDNERNIIIDALKIYQGAAEHYKQRPELEADCLEIEQDVRKMLYTLNQAKEGWDIVYTMLPRAKQHIVIGIQYYISHLEELIKKFSEDVGSDMRPNLPQLSAKIDYMTKLGARIVSMDL